MTGEPLSFATVFLEGTKLGDVSDDRGFFNIAGISAGEYQLLVSYLGFDTLRIPMTIRGNQIINKQLYLTVSATLLGEVSVSGK